MRRSTRKALLRFNAFLLIGCLLAGSQISLAQTIYGSISGTVVDQSGAAIKEATVIVKNRETGLSRETKTNDLGLYAITSLPIGNYSAEVSAPSFGKKARENLLVSVSVNTTVDFTLEPAGATETINVTTEAPLMDTVKSQVSREVESRRILELPGRNSLNGLALLQPGVVNNQNGRPGSGFAVNGGRTRSNNFTIDGANNNDQSLSIPRQNLSPETIQQFQIVTNNFSAEYGRNSGAYINQITKSGTNDFHGIVMWTWQGNGLDALTTGEERTFKAGKTLGLTDKQAVRRARGVTVDNLGGGFVGGPIKPDHTFFFVGYDRQWFRTTAVPTPTIAISPQGIANLQANAGRFAPGALDFLTNTFPTANDPAPRGQINVALPGGPTIPVPLQQFNRALTGAFPFGTTFWRLMPKIDSRLTSNDNLSGRYLINESKNPGSPSPIPGNEIGTVSRDQSITLNEVHVFGPRTVNEFRFTYSRRKINFPENVPPTFIVTGFNAVGNANFPQFRTDNVFEYMDNVTRNQGRHALKMGVNVLRYQLNSFFAPNTRGTVAYNSLTDFLLDRNAGFSQFAGDGYVPARTTEFSTFFQDDFRWTSNLTLNLGLRYEYTGAPFGYFSNAKPDINNLAPRFGFAYNPRAEGGWLGWLTGGDKLVIRGGYAISYDQVFQNILLNNSRNFPRGVNVALNNITGQRLYNPANRPAAPTPQDFVARGGNPELLPVRLYSPNKRITQPYGQQFSLGIERQFMGDYKLSVFYIGSRGLHLVREVESNIGFQVAAVNANPSVYAEILPKLQPVRNSAGVITSYRVDPTKGSILIGDGIASSTYHSLQITLDKRLSNGLQFQANYTWSSFINDSDDILGGTINNTLPAVPFNYSLERARSGLDQPHRFVANYIYQFPMLLERNALLGRLLGGWQFSGVTTLASGTPFTILNSANALGILPGQIATVEGSQRASVNNSGTRPLPTSSTVSSPFYVFNGANSGIIGTAGRNTERTGGTNTTNMALVKNTRTFRESQSLQLRWEVFNVFNRRNFTTIPTSTVTADTDVTRFLNLGQTNVGGRSMLFTARYFF